MGRRVGAAVVILLVLIAVAWVLTGERGAPGGSTESPTAPAEGALERAGLRIGEGTLAVEIADTPAARARGLSQRDALAGDAGMLFLFPEVPKPAAHTFWMEDMRIPLDLVWIRENRVIGITADVQPEPGVADADLRRYPSPGPVDAVLEVNAGWAARHGVTVGDPLRTDLVG